MRAILKRRDSLSKNIAFYLMLLCLIISIAMKNFDVIQTIANVSCFVFVLLYAKEELKTYTRKSLGILSICFLFLVGICTFMILQGQAFIKDHPPLYRLGNNSGHSFDYRFFKHLCFYLEEDFKSVKTLVS